MNLCLAYIRIIFIFTENGCFESMCSTAEIYRRYALSYLRMEYIIYSSKVYRGADGRRCFVASTTFSAPILDIIVHKGGISVPAAIGEPFPSLPASRVHCKSSPVERTSNPRRVINPGKTRVARPTTRHEYV